MDYRIKIEIENEDTGELIMKDDYPSMELLEMDLGKMESVIEEEKDKEDLCKI